MAVPEFVPTKPTAKVRAYASPPRREHSWKAERPGDFADSQRQPKGERLGNQGPDQGYALKLARLLEPELVLADGEHARDALAGIVAVGLKRASKFGRAPVMADLRIAATLFGYLDSGADAELVRMRKDLFEEVGHFHHYAELRHIADLVSEDVVAQTPQQVIDRYNANWRDQLSLDG